MGRTRPQINIVVDFPGEGGDIASLAWVRATEILLKAKARRDGKIMEVGNIGLEKAEVETPCNASI